MAKIFLKYILAYYMLLTLSLNHLEASQIDSQQQITTSDDNNQLSTQKVCCNIINEAEIDLKFFTELCKSVIEREMSTEAGIRMYRQDRYPPPGMLERCRKSMLEACGVDISSALLSNGAENMARRQNKTDSSSPKSPYQINITQCLLSMLDAKISNAALKKNKQTNLLPSYMHQERPLYYHAPPENLALKEKGSIFPTFNYKAKKSETEKSNANTAVLSFTKKSKESDNTAFNILEPIYKFSVTLFVISTMIKFLTKTSDNVSKSSSSNSNGFYSHVNGVSSNIDEKNVEVCCLEEEIDVDVIENDEISTLINADDMITAYEDLPENPIDVAQQDNQLEEIKEEESVLLKNLRNLMESEAAKIAVIGMEVQAQFSDKKSTENRESPERLPVGAEEGEEEGGESESSGETVVVTGRMLISLLGRGKDNEVMESQVLSLSPPLSTPN